MAFARHPANDQRRLYPPQAARRVTTYFDAAHGTIEVIFGFTVADTSSGRLHRSVSGLEHKIIRRTYVSGGLALVSDKQARHKPPGKKAAPAAEAKEREMGAALRSIYQNTIDENVPDEMMTLLGKLD